MDYITDVVAAAQGFWILALLLYVVYLLSGEELLDNVFGKFATLVPQAILVLAIFGTMIGVVSPLKEYSDARELRRIDQLDARDGAQIIT